MRWNVFDFMDVLIVAIAIWQSPYFFPLCKGGGGGDLLLGTKFRYVYPLKYLVIGVAICYWAT